MSLGTYPSVTVAEAHTRAIEARGYLDAKPQIDPRDRLRKSDPGAMKIAELAESYLTLRARPHLRSAKKIEWALRKHVLPVIGQITLDDLTKREVNRVIDPITAGKKVAAARTFQRLRAMFSWAVSRGDLGANPMDTMTKPEEQPPRKRILSEDEIKLLWHALPNACPSRSVERILKLCLITGQRVGEVSGMATGELHLDARKWIIPDYRVKNKQDHEVPLSPLAIALIREAMVDAGDSHFVFPGLRGRENISSSVVSSGVIEARKSIGLPHWTAHDLGIIACLPQRRPVQIPRDRNWRGSRTMRRRSPKQ
jgi:integrase